MKSGFEKGADCICDLFERPRGDLSGVAQEEEEEEGKEEEEETASMMMILMVAPLGGGGHQGRVGCLCRCVHVSFMIFCEGLVIR